MRLIVFLIVIQLAQPAQRSDSAPPPQPSPAFQGDVPSVVVEAEKSWAGAGVLWPLAKSGDPAVARYAVRAIGRLEDPANVPALLVLGRQTVPGPAAVAAAIAQSLNGFDPARDPGLVASVLSWLQTVTFVEAQRQPMPAAIGSIHWGTPAQVHAAEEALLRVLTWAASAKTRATFYLGSARSLDSLARLNAKVTAFNPATVARLSRIVARTSANDDDAAREAALGALIGARALDSHTELVALRDASAHVRRLATSALGGAGGGLDDERRLDAIQEKLTDRDGQVRYEAVRAYARRSAPVRGCDPLLNSIADSDVHVALAAIDALGDACKQDDDVTTRIAVEAAPPPGSAWHRAAHALVALARRAPERAAIVMEAFVTHSSPWVRMYAARAAGAAGDVARLEKLASDANDNVREAALTPLWRMKKDDANDAVVAALERNDIQLVRTAATLLKEAPRTDRTARALVAALQRLTKEGKETSRDARLPLLDAIDVHAGPGVALQLQPLLKDFDPFVAARAASVISRLSGRSVTADPAAVPRGWPAHADELGQCVAVNLSSGKSFTLRMNPTDAPVTVDRFLRLALVDHYYDGLTIHRVAPNFVIQGGGPGGNEYSGHKEYMRDEIGARNSRGTVGLSTRGRNTADGQFYVNLIDNARLDQDYTVFASVVPSDMSAVDAIQEGEVMRRLSPVNCATSR